jgi:hypothetical protein
MSVAATANFGAYLLLPISGEMLIGLCNDPANENGAVLVRSADGVNFSAETVLSEQGVVDGQVLGDGRVYVCGLDPYEDWTFGNIYERSAGGVWTKRRTIPNGIHCLGLWHDNTNLYAAIGAHTGDSATWRGRVLKSTDDGATWTQTVDVNDYRIYDVIGFDGKLYATGVDWTGSAYEYELYRSDDDGQTWQTLAPAISYRPRLTEYSSNLYAVGYDLVSLIEIQPGGTLVTRALQFTAVNSWNALCVDAAGRLNVLATSGVWRTSDLTEWEFVVAGAWISLTWWPSAAALMVSELGTAARILKVVI